MNIPITELINYIKFQLSTGSNTDPVVSTIGDNDIEVLIKIHCGTLALTFPTIPYGYMQLLSCLVRKELYWKLATANAPFTPLKTDGTELNKNYRFTHYTQMIQEVTKEYNDIMNDPTRLPEDFGKGRLKAYDLVINKDYVLNRYVNTQDIPQVNIFIDNIVENSLEVSLDLSKVKVTDYIKTSIYLNEESKIVDEYDLNKIAKNTELKYQTYNIHNSKARIPYKKPGTKYLLLVIELNYGLKAYKEIEVSM